MRSRISAAALAAGLALLTGCLTATPGRGAAANVWPAQVPPVPDEAALAQRIAGLEAAGATLPPELAPTIRFEEAFVRIVAQAGEADWLPTIRALAEAPATDPVTASLRDVAKAWIARVEMREIGAVLDDFYARHVRYPNSLTEVDRDLPKDLKTDPWGEAWVYRTHAPAGFGREVVQRYSIGPKRFPDLGTLKEATVDRAPFTPPAWKIALRAVGDSVALEFRRGGAQVGLLQAGGKLDAYTLVYVGDRWALLAAPDQLFTATF